MQANTPQPLEKTPDPAGSAKLDRRLLARLRRMLGQQEGLPPGAKDRTKAHPKPRGVKKRTGPKTSVEQRRVLLALTSTSQRPPTIRAKTQRALIRKGLLTAAGRPTPAGRAVAKRARKRARA